MRTPPLLAALLALGAIALTGCTAAPTIDWAEAEAAASDYESVATGDDTLGSGTLRLEPHGTNAHEEASVTLTYEEETRLDGAALVCFGSGTAQVGYSLRVGSSWQGVDSLPLECDGTEHTDLIDVPVEGVTAVRITGMMSDGDGGMFVAVFSGRPVAD